MKGVASGGHWVDLPSDIYPTSVSVFSPVKSGCGHLSQRATGEWEVPSTFLASSHCPKH